MTLKRVASPVVSKDGVPAAPVGTGGFKNPPAALTNTQFADLISRRSEIEVMMAVRMVETPNGAARMWAAEVDGKKRHKVLAAISRKLDELTNMT